MTKFTENVKALASNPAISTPDGGVLNAYAYEAVGSRAIKFYGDYVTPDGSSIKTDVNLTIKTKEDLKDGFKSFLWSSWDNYGNWDSWEIKK